MPSVARNSPQPRGPNTSQDGVCRVLTSPLLDIQMRKLRPHSREAAGPGPQPSSFLGGLWSSSHRSQRGGLALPNRPRVATTLPGPQGLRSREESCTQERGTQAPSFRVTEVRGVSGLTGPLGLSLLPRPGRWRRAVQGWAQAGLSPFSRVPRRLLPQTTSRGQHQP